MCAADVLSPDKHDAAPVWEVRADAGFANAELNGARVLLVHTVAVGIVEALIISGPMSGRRWQFMSKHLREVAHG